VVLICGEEGTGKSWLAHQLAAEIVAGGKAFGEFDIPRPVRSVLIVDVEQSEDDVRIIRDEMLRRGVLSAAADIYWLEATGRALDQSDDITWLIQQVATYRPEVIVLDTATNAVTDPMDDKAVRRMTTLLRWFVKNTDVRAVVGLAQPRKTGQSADAKARSFDSLFGSRAWKSEPSAVFWMTETELTVWKQRGSYLRRRWGATTGRIKRSEDGPTTILAPQPEAEAEADRRSQIIAAVGLNPGRYSKTSLIEDELSVSGHLRPAWRKTVERLEADGALVSEGQYHKLRLGSPPSPPQSA
jgi:hypothetical protein